MRERHDTWETFCCLTLMILYSPGDVFAYFSRLLICSVEIIATPHLIYCRRCRSGGLIDNLERSRGTI